MKVILPIALQDWYQEHNPSDGDVIFVGAVTLFARLFGLQMWQDWDGLDVRALLHNKGTAVSTPCKDLKAQGAIEYGEFVDGVVTIRLPNDIGMSDINLTDKVFYAPITDTRAIMVFSYFLGRMTDVYDETHIKPLNVAPKCTAKGKIIEKHKASRIVIPAQYRHQFNQCAEFYD